MKKGWWLLVVLMMAGCSSQPASVEKSVTEVSEGVCGDTLPKQHRMRITLAKQAFQRGEYFSALATLDQVDGDWITKKTLQASAYRKTEQWDKAESLYIQLMSSCIRGNAEHGLGLIAAYKGDLEDARSWLEQAVGTEPTNANIRNDYGFILLSLGRKALARNELITALELNPNHETAAKNLWLLLSVSGETNAAFSLQQRFSWNSSQMDKLNNAVYSFNEISAKKA